MRQSYLLQAYEKHMGLWRSLASEPLRWGVSGQHQRAFSALCFPPTNPPPPRWQKLGRVAVFLDRIVKVMAAQRSKKNVNAAARSVLKPCCLGQQAAVVHSVLSGRSRSQTNKCIEHQLVDLQAVVERALARAKCSLGWNSNRTDAGLAWRRLDVVDELRHTPFEEVG